MKATGQVKGKVTSQIMSQITGKATGQTTAKVTHQIRGQITGRLRARSQGRAEVRSSIPVPVQGQRAGQGPVRNYIYQIQVMSQVIPWVGSKISSFIKRILLKFQGSDETGRKDAHATLP